MITRTVSELADLCGARLEGDGSAVVVGPATLQDAGPDQVSFLGHPKYKGLLEETRAAAVLVDQEVDCARRDLPLLRCEDPSRAFTEVVRAFAEADRSFPAGVHPSAIVEDGAEIDAEAYVGPLCTVGPGAVVGRGAALVAHVHVGREVRIGADTVVHPFVSLYPRTVLGERCLVHAGAVLGADGFGFEPSAQGWSKVPQCGWVEVEDDVELGANTTVDRGRFGATRIGRGSKLDNLVHIGHNVQVGPGALLVAQAGVAGSSRVGKGAILAGQVGISGHLDIGEGARVGGKSGVFRDVPPGADYLGYPAKPIRETVRAGGAARRVEQLILRVRELEKRLRRMERREGGA